MRFFLMLLLLLAGQSLLSNIHSSLAADTWCIADPLHPPCKGAPGKCTSNSNGEKGGFVADTAYVEQSWLAWALGSSRNRPFIGQFAQVCDTARVSGNARISDYSRVFDHAEVSGHAQVCWYARVFGNAKVSQNAQVSRFAQVYDNGQVLGDGWVSGDFKVFGNTQILTGLWFMNSPVENILGNSDESKTRNGPHAPFTYQKLQEDHLSYLTTLPERNEIQKEIEEETIKFEQKIQTLNRQLEKLDANLEICPICHDTLQKKGDLISTKCQHIFCKTCFNQLKGRPRICPLCRSQITKKDRARIKYPTYPTF